jgi:hypothetical protein
LEFVPGDGRPAERFACSPEIASELLKEAARRAKVAGFEWERKPIQLKPSPKLSDLIRRSRELATESGDGGK